jgi:hypothetical protein
VSTLTIITRLEGQKQQFLEAGKPFIVKKNKRTCDPQGNRHSMFDEELDKYSTYEEYLDSLVNEDDHKYLQDEEMARTIAELGYRSAIWKEKNETFGYSHYPRSNLNIYSVKLGKHHNSAAFSHNASPQIEKNIILPQFRSKILFSHCSAAKILFSHNSAAKVNIAKRT